MPVSFGDTWRAVRLRAPGAPFALCRDWTASAYTLLHERRPWVWSTKEGRLTIQAARSLSVTFTQGTPTITSAAGFVAADVGRQIRVTYPIYTIISLTSTSVATLDMDYGEADGTSTATIASIYATMPVDFGAFLLVADPSNQRQISYWHTQETLARIDLTRTQTGAPVRALVAQTLSPVPATLGQSRYEWWPRSLTAVTYPYWYRQRPQLLADTTPLPGVLQHANNVLVSGALMEASRWPGTTDQPNPYFNLATYKSHKDDFEQQAARLELRDDDQAQQTWSVLPYHRWPVWDLLGDTRILRSSDATLADYI